MSVTYQFFKHINDERTCLITGPSGGSTQGNLENQVNLMGGFIY